MKPVVAARCHLSQTGNISLPAPPLSLFGFSNFRSSSFQKPIQKSTQICLSWCWRLTNWWCAILFSISTKIWIFDDILFTINKLFLPPPKSIYILIFFNRLEDWKLRLQYPDFKKAHLSLKFKFEGFPPPFFCGVFIYFKQLFLHREIQHGEWGKLTNQFNNKVIQKAWLN